MAPKQTKKVTATATGPPKKKGAAKRAARVVLGKETRLVAQESPYLFWNPSLHLEAPPLRTSFGNFSTLNLVNRFTVASATGGDTVLWVPYTASPLAAMTVFSGYSPNQHIYGPLTSSAPLAVRPLRMGVEIKNITTHMNAGGVVQVLSVDNALATSFVLTATVSGGAYLDSGSLTSLLALVSGAEETKTFTAEELLRGHTFVSVPSAWPEYNSYSDFVSFTYTTDGASIASGDVWALNQGGSSPATPFPGAGTFPINGSWGDVPAMRGFLIVFKASPLSNTYEVTCRRQDGARYPANSLGHMFHTAAKQASVAGEDMMIATAKAVSANPSSGYLTSLMDKAASIASGLGHAALNEAGLALQNQFFSGSRAAPLTRSMARLAIAA